MSEHNTAIRMAQNLLRRRAKSFPDVEIGYHQFAAHPSTTAYERAATDLEDLIYPEEKN